VSLSVGDERRKRLWEHVRRLAPVVMPLCYVAFTLIVYWRMWTPIDGARGFFRFDPRFEYWGDLVFQTDSLHHGVLALWNPHDRGGFPLFGDPQPGMFYPGNWLFWVYGLLTGGVGYMAVGVKILAHWAFGAIGMHLFLRRLGAREPACYVGGLLFGWTCPKIRYAGSALNWSIAWIPWLLLAIQWFAEKPSYRRGILLGSCAAMVLLAGAPAVLIYAAVIALPFAIYALWGRLSASLKHLAVAAGVALLWVLPLVASNMAQVPESVRESRTLDFITDSAFSPADFVGFLAPRLSGENVYYGIFAILCAGLLVASAGRVRALLFLAIAATGTALALGNQAGVLSAAASVFPPFGFFRRAHRYLFITSIAAAVLAGLGFAHALSLEAEERKRVLARHVTWVGGLITFGLGMAYLVSVTVHDKLQSPKNVGLGLGFLSAAAGTWLLRAILVNSGTRQRIYAWFAVVVVALDIWTANAKVIDVGWTPPPKPLHDGAVAELADVKTEWRVYDRGYLDFRPGTRLGIRDFGGYEDDPLGLSRYRELLRAAQHNLSLLGHANVRYYLDGGRQPRLEPRPTDAMKRLEKGIYELTRVAPAVMYVPAPRRVADTGEGVRALTQIRPGEGAVYEGETMPEGPVDAAATSGRITLLEPNHVVAEIDVPGPGMIVVAEAYFPAWAATVNGREVAIQPANVMFRGVPVTEAGHTIVEMRLRPLRFWGLLPTYLAALGLLGWALIGRSSGRRRGRRSPESSKPPTSDPPTAGESA